MKRIKIGFIISVLTPLFILFLSFRVPDNIEPYSFPKIPYFPPMPVSAENPVTIKGAELGRYLFYDPILSIDSNLSCAGCHKQQYAFSDSPNTFSKGFKNLPQSRNTPALFNLAWYPKLFWDGRANSIETQVFQPVNDHKEMNLNWLEAAKRIKRSVFYAQKITEIYGNKNIDSVLISKLIAQFERTLISYNSKYDKVLNKKAKFTLEELEGFELMNDMTKGNCLHCHTTDANGLGTTGEFSNNGLDEVRGSTAFKDSGLALTTGKRSDAGKFKIPSLRNLLYTAPYMHDGRFKTLEEVLDFYSEGVQLSSSIDSRLGHMPNSKPTLTASEKRKIILFLKTLSDPIFIRTKEFSSPFN